MEEKHITPQALDTAIDRFETWLYHYGFVSYDQFDFWGSKLGVASKSLFQRSKLAAAPLVIFMQSMESFFPASRKLFAKKQRFAIGDAHYAMGFQNRHKVTGKADYLNTAKELLDVLQRSATQTDHGIGWGYPYRWVTQFAVMPPGTPFITVSPYAFYAFLKMHDLTGEQRYLDTAKQVADFGAYDLHEQSIGMEVASASYSPLDAGQVVNANTYRAAMLMVAYERFGEEAYREKALRNLRFVVGQQAGDGSWDYAPDAPFIDNFHTCFVLKNLYRANQVAALPEVTEAIKKGYKYYRQYLFRQDNSPIHFSKVRYPKFRKIEMYDYAEGILLGVQLADLIPEAADFARVLARQLVEQFQLPAGHFVTRVTTMGTRNTTPYLRWPQAQLFYALTELQRSLTPTTS
ncbi:MAG: hypothetical protein AAGB22_06850 [Bacteroidota bacterium]